MQQEQENLYSALCTVQRFLAESDTNILTDRKRTLNYLADILSNDKKSRSRMRMFYDSGAADVLVKKNLPAEQLCRRAANVYINYTDSREDVAMEVAGAVIRALGMELSEEWAAGPAAAAPVGKAELPDVRKRLSELRATAMLRDGSTGENKQRLAEQVSEMMGELFCTLIDSKLMEEQEQLLARMDASSEQEQEAIRARLRQIYRLTAEYGVDVNLAANVDVDPRDAEKMAVRQNPVNRASIELSSLVFRRRKASGAMRCQLEEQIEKKLDEIMILLEEYEEEPEPQPRRSVPGTIVPAMCSRVHLAGRDLVFKKAVQDQGLWDSWPEARQIQEGSLETATYETLDRLLCVYEKGAQTDPDCMQLLADLYYSGMDSDIGRFHAEGALLPRNRQKSQYWEKKAAEAGHCIALFNQGLEALMAGDLDRAEELGQRSVQSTVGMRITDGHYLLALVELVRWKQALGNKNDIFSQHVKVELVRLNQVLSNASQYVIGAPYYKKALEELSAALSGGQGSLENRPDMLNCSSALRQEYRSLYG